MLHCFKICGISFNKFPLSPLMKGTFPVFRLKQLPGWFCLFNYAVFSSPKTPLLRWWQTRKHCCGYMAADDVFLASKRGNIIYLWTHNVSERNQKHFCDSDTNFVSSTNAVRGGIQEKICVRHYVSFHARKSCAHLARILKIASERKTTKQRVLS